MNEQPVWDSRESDEGLILVPVPLPIAFVQLRESLDDIEEGSPDASLLFWIVSLLTFGLGDTISSFLVFSRGGTEANPIMAFALTLPTGLIGFVLIKMIAMSLLYATAYLWEGAHRWLIPILMTIAGVWLTTQNTLVYLSLT